MIDQRTINPDGGMLAAELVVIINALTPDSDFIRLPMKCWKYM